MTSPSRLHTIYLREETPFWIKSHAVAVFKPQDAIPSFQKFNDGYTDYEWSEYEDLLFLPLLAHFLSEIPRFGGPKLLSMTKDIEKRAGLMSDIENFLRQKT
jgi:hypothetical protein